MSESSALNQLYEERVRPCIDLVDSFRSLGLENDLNLPAIAVIGDQSSGKSSVLEALSGVGLPRGTGIVTRCPLVLKLKRINQELECKDWNGILSYRDQTIPIKDPMEIENLVIYAQGVLTGNEEGISHEMITLEIQSENVPDLTLIDLPGIARVATGNQPQDIDKQIKDLIEKFIKRQETIILVVVPANIDIATTEALQMAKQMDSDGERTLGILTKPDLVDKGTEETVVKTVKNEVIELKKGYMIVKCRGQNDINERLDLKKALEKEKSFFEEHTHFRSLSEEGYATIPCLAERLTKELVEHIIKTLPELQRQLDMKIEKTSAALRALGDGVPLDEYDKKHLLATKVQQLHDTLEKVKRAEEEVKKKKGARLFSKIREEFKNWKHDLYAKANKTEEILSVEVAEYVKTHRGMELPGFSNYRTFESIVKEHIEELEQPALKLLRDVKAIVHSSVNHILNDNFSGFFELVRAAKEPNENILDEQFEKAEENILSQFKMEKLVYSQDDLYINQQDQVKKQSVAYQGLLEPSVNQDVRDMGYHLITYLTITSERLANQIPLIVRYHMLEGYISQLQSAMLIMIGGDPEMLLQEDSGVLSKRRELTDQLKRLKKAGIALSKHAFCG